MRVLILGGYGTFGGRLIRLLSDDPRLTLICAGRSLNKATAFLSDIKGEADLIPHALDRNDDLSGPLAALTPDLIVDATGPFQTYGERPYRVVEAALAARINYTDLADGAAFVADITAFDAQAKAARITVLSGASTYPALSSAVTRHLTQGWQRIDSIVSGLAPSPKAGLGRNVIEAIMSYAGKPVPVIRGGKRTTAPALIDSRRLTIAPPGEIPLGPLRFSLTELPDNTLAPDIWPDLRELWPGVGTRPQALLRVLNLSAHLVKWRVLRSLTPLAGTAFWTMKRMAWGEHRGGLIMKISGLDVDSTPISREWHMLAIGDDGPFIPSMAVAALIRRRLDGEPQEPGARPATHDVSLADYEAQFATKKITTGIVESPTKDAPLYQRVLGPAWHRLPEPIRKMHTAPNGVTVTGEATVERGTNPLSRLIGAVVGFPKAGSGIPVSVTFTEKDGGELWQRTFAGKRFESFQKQGTGAFAYHLSERFGPLEFALALEVRDDQLWLITRKWRAFGIPMPRFMAPGGDAFEHVENGKFHFHVEIKHWLTGLIVRYRGHLAPANGNE